jgi:HPt (histidine-containing phosphotransfer) domain-containing protein
MKLKDILMIDHNFTFDSHLDADILYELYENDYEHACIAFNEFLHLAPALMQEIEQSYSSGITENFRQKVHKLKPMFSFVGLPEMTAMAETLEKRCKEVAHPSELRLLYEDLKSMYIGNLPIIQQEVNRLTDLEN